MEIRTPRSFAGSWLEAHELSKAEVEPVFVPIKPFADDRGWSLMNLLAGAMTDQGQINFLVQYPGAVKAWHRNDRQSDFGRPAVLRDGHVQSRAAGRAPNALGCRGGLSLGNQEPMRPIKIS